MASFFARNIYETGTVISGLCYIEDLIFLKNNIVWFWNSLDVQSSDSSVELYIYMYIFWIYIYIYIFKFEDLFEDIFKFEDSNNFLNQIWKRVHNATETILYNVNNIVERTFYLYVLYIFYQYIFILAVFIYSIMEV